MVSSNDITIRQLNAADVTARLPEFIALLQDGVDSGASIGFLRPLQAEEAQVYWQGVIGALAKNSKFLLIAENAAGALVGTVQLEPAGRANGLHRAEVQKLMVHTSARGKGVARQLLQALEELALRHKLTLLVLDTVEGDTAEQLYPKIGYVRVGIVPNFVYDETGKMLTTVYFYKLLEQAA